MLRARAAGLKLMVPVFLANRDLSARDLAVSAPVRLIVQPLVVRIDVQGHIHPLPMY